MPQPSVPEGVIRESVDFSGGPFRLEGELAYPGCGRPGAVAVIAPPHPLLGGDMRNNVVRGLSEGLAQLGLATLRFNYRGVGASEGPERDLAAHLAAFWETSHVPDEMDHRDDLAAALEFARQAVPRGLPVAVVGYSFGCAVAAGTPAVRDAAALALVAPTARRHDYTALETLRLATLVVAARDDFATDAADLDRLFQRIAGRKRLVRRRLDNHFFRGHEPWLVQTVFDFLCTTGVLSDGRRTSDPAARQNGPERAGARTAAQHAVPSSSPGAR